jgi:hypothetical protein
VTRRRRRNPTFSETVDVGTLLLFGVGAYLLYQFFQPAGSGAGAAYNSFTSWIASFFPGTSPSVVVQGTVNLPGGSTIPVSSLTSNGFNSDGSLSMSDASGNTYSVTSLGNGTYQAS